LRSVVSIFNRADLLKWCSRILVLLHFNAVQLLTKKQARVVSSGLNFFINKSDYAGFSIGHSGRDGLVDHPIVASLVNDIARLAIATAFPLSCYVFTRAWDIHQGPPLLSRVS
jgi:hypothetical protein